MLSTIFLWLAASLLTRVAADCNPLTTSDCPAIPGLATSSYSIDFTQVKSLPSDWILAAASNVSFGSQGLQFNFNKRGDAPYIWTNFYVAYGRIDVVLQAAQGTGIITSSVMFSDDADEIDWEFSGSNFGAGVANGKVQTNVFAKGITGNYDRGTQPSVSPPPQSAFHTYSLNWTPQQIDWILDGVTIRTETNNGLKVGNYQFPQTPSRLHIGVWDAGDPNTALGTRQWAGGLTDYSNCPYVAYVKSVKISTPYPCKAWKYPENFSGSWSDVQCTNDALPSSVSATSTSSSAVPQSTMASYTVVVGDNGYIIAGKLGCTFAQLQAANPNVQWDYLNIGQSLKNPGYKGPPIVSSSTSSTVTSRSSHKSSSTSVGGTTSAPSVCIRNRCYSNMLGSQFITSAMSYCSSRSRLPLSILPVPTYLTACSNNQSQIMTACNCLSSKQSAVTSNPGSSTTAAKTYASSYAILPPLLISSTTPSVTAAKLKTGSATPTKTTASGQGGWNGWSGWSWKRSESSEHHAGHYRDHEAEHHSKGHRHGRIAKAYHR